MSWEGMSIRQWNLIKYDMKNHSQNVIEKVVQDPFYKNQN